MMGKKGFEQKRKEVEDHRRESFFSEELRTSHNDKQVILLIDSLVYSFVVLIFAVRTFMWTSGAVGNNRTLHAG
jgi:hypothetical protein